jgi:hypothetical protein
MPIDSRTPEIADACGLCASRNAIVAARSPSTTTDSDVVYGVAEALTIRTVRTDSTVVPTRAEMPLPGSTQTACAR